MKDDFELLRGLANCADKEQMMRYIEEHQPKPMTNADRIRAMTDEELADWLARTQIANVAEALDIARIPWEQAPNMKDEVKKECLEWLQQPVEGSE